MMEKDVNTSRKQSTYTEKVSFATQHVTLENNRWIYIIPTRLSFPISILQE